jgi:hypothetical protein
MFLLVQYIVFGISIYASAHKSFLDVVMVFVRGLNRNDFLKILFFVFLLKSV